MPHERVAVGVQTGRRHRHHDVTLAHQLGAEQRVGLDHTGGGAGDVVLVRVEQAGMLGRLATEQRGAGLGAGLRDALDDVGDALGHHTSAGDVVGEEQGLGTAHHEVVDEHADEVEADGVVDVHGLRDRDLRAHTVGGGGQQRTLVRLEGRGVEQSGEAADAADDLRTAGLLDPLLHQLDGAVAGLDRDAGRFVVRHLGVPADV